MHNLYFQFKRSYWGMQNKVRQPLKDMEITAARVDMLYAITNMEFGVEQRTLAGALGVKKSVVSRMLKALLMQELVEREKSKRDRRMWIVRLTTAGKEKLDAVFKRFVRSHRIKKWIFEALVGPDWRKKRQERHWELMVIDESVQHIRDWFGGGGTIYYPWHPDD